MLIQTATHHDLTNTIKIVLLSGVLIVVFYLLTTMPRTKTETPFQNGFSYDPQPAGRDIKYYVPNH